MADYNPVIDKLLGKTVEGKVTWKQTYEENTFIANLDGEFSFEVGRVNAEMVTFTMKDKDNNKLVEMICHDQLPYQQQGYDTYYDKVAQLHELARISALDVNRKLEAVERLLDGF